MTSLSEQPAFPQPYVSPPDGDKGMTLRDYFAAAALQGLCAGFAANDKSWPSDRSPEHYEVAAEHAYEMADAMLEARDGRG